nr:uncharacterized protein LOC128698120 [Cherax quadricarinatus]
MSSVTLSRWDLHLHRLNQNILITLRHTADHCSTPDPTADPRTRFPSVKHKRSSRNKDVCNLPFNFRGGGGVGSVGRSLCGGVVAGPIAGAAVSSSPLVAAVTSLLTGFCYVELVSWSGQCSGQVYTVTYQLVGELPAFTLGIINTLFTASTLAAVSKSLSATMDYLSGRKVESFVAAHLGRLPLYNTTPDFIAAGASLSVAVILAFGLEVSVGRPGDVLGDLGMCWETWGCVGRPMDVLGDLWMCWETWGCVGRPGDMLGDLGMCWETWECSGGGMRVFRKDLGA